MQNCPVIISLTTTPWRIDGVKIVIENLLVQSLKPNKIHLYLPIRCIRDESEYVIPKDLLEIAERNPVFEITRIPEDYGPASKLLPSLERYTDPNTRIVIVDDDNLLEQHTLEELVHASIKDPTAVFGMMGVNDRKAFIHAEWLPFLGLERCPVVGLGGYRGVVYRRGLLDDSLFSDYREVLNYINPYLSDDHLFAWNLYRRGIPRYVITTKYPKPNTPLTNLECLNITFLSRDKPLACDEMCSRGYDATLKMYQNKGWKHP